MKNLTLNDFLEVALKILEEKTKKRWSLSIHITTDLEEVKGNVQGRINKLQRQGKADILISGVVKFKNLSKVLAHELVHLIYPNLEEEEKKFNEKVKEIKKEIEKELKKKGGTK
ncbi:MAG: hypothetical protein ACP5RO_07810 [Fervidicoccaceae archaeon]